MTNNQIENYTDKIRLITTYYFTNYCGGIGVSFLAKR